MDGIETWPAGHELDPESQGSCSAPALAAVARNPDSKGSQGCQGPVSLSISRDLVERVNKMILGRLTRQSRPAKLRKILHFCLCPTKMCPGFVSCGRAFFPVQQSQLHATSANQALKKNALVSYLTARGLCGYAAHRMAYKARGRARTLDIVGSQVQSLLPPTISISRL